MPKESTRLRAADLREIYLLIGECCELGADPLIWRQHLLRRLNELFGAVSSVDIEASYDENRSGVGVKVDMALTLDHFTRHERTLLTRCLREMPMDANALGVELVRCCPPLGSIAAVRREYVDSRTWEQCEFFTEYFTPLAWHDVMGAMMNLPAGFRYYNFSRARGDGPFSLRSARMLQLLVKELAAIPSHRLAPMTGPSLSDLPPRLREVLLALVEGDNEKQVAVRLGISRNTVHEYVRRLFERFGVSSRSELLVRAARQLHAFELTPTSQENHSWCYRARLT